MKRIIGLIILAVVIIAGINLLKTKAPFMATVGTSMEPYLKQGDLILIKPIEDPSQIKVGNVIVFNVPPAIQAQYQYPPIIAHRVIKVDDSNGVLTFRTKGDNTNPDPFTVLTSNLKGEVSSTIPYLGYLVLFLESRQGLIFLVITFFLIGLYLYSNELDGGFRGLQEWTFSPVMKQNEELAKKQDLTIQAVSEALEQFTIAMNEYAEHLRSHTAAIQGLARAAQELKEVTQELKDATREKNGVPTVSHSSGEIKQENITVINELSGGNELNMSRDDNGQVS